MNDRDHHATSPRANRRSTTLSSGVALALALAAASAGAAQLETLVVDVAGQSGYPTYRAPQLIVDFFGGNGVGLPSNGLPVGGLPGVERGKTAATGPLLDAASASGAGVGTFGPWSANGSSSANAIYGKVGAAGSGSMVSFGDANTVAGFEAAALFSDSMTVPDAVRNGQHGSAVLHFTIDGSLAVSGPGAAAIFANYRKDSGPVFTLMTASIQAGTATFAPQTGSGRAGYTVTPTSISGAGVFDTVALDVVFGTPFELTFGVFAYAIPRLGSADSSFASTALLTGIDIFDAAGRPIDDFSIVSGSGTFYGANGVQIAAVPEPTTAALLATGLAGMLAAWRRRRGTTGAT
ncbi:MAG TPA: PEP-CTERM sorting domain-containing protein [Caldimonas sp.]|nr:PEP-CTERM sorting domain-containing protein [Caldimonas sp.]